jgi:hypothetical protein
MRIIQPVVDGKRAALLPVRDRKNPELKGLVVEASRALARLDAERLEELALCCEALNRELVLREPEAGGDLARQAMDATADMAVFSRVLAATRANLSVMRRLRELRGERLEYRESQVMGWAGLGTGHGDN